MSEISLSGKLFDQLLDTLGKLLYMTTPLLALSLRITSDYLALPAHRGDQALTTRMTGNHPVKNTSVHWEEDRDGIHDLKAE